MTSSQKQTRVVLKTAHVLSGRMRFNTAVFNSALTLKMVRVFQVANPGKAARK